MAISERKPLFFPIITGSGSQYRLLLLATSCVAGSYLWYLLSRPRKSKRPATDFNSFLKKVSEPAAAAPTPAGPPRRGLTSFSAFLRDGGPPAARDATSFSAFLKNRPDAAAAQPAAAASPSADDAQGAGSAQPSADSVVVTVLYGTEYGFSREIAEKLRDRLRGLPPYWSVPWCLPPARVAQHPIDGLGSASARDRQCSAAACRWQ
jgi:hypothetical protein